MDQRTSDVEEDLKDILRTRMALADKLQLLEQRVDEKVHGAKMAALAVIDHAKNTAVDFMESTTNKLDPRVQAERRPWLLVGSAIAIGFLAGLAGLMDQRREGSIYPYYPPQARGADVMPSEGDWEPRRGVYPFYPAHAESQPEHAGDGRAAEQGRGARGSFAALKQVSSLWGDFTGQFAKERERLQGAALQTGRAFLQDLAHIVAQSLIDALERRPSPRSSRHDRTAGI